MTADFERKKNLRPSRRGPATASSPSDSMFKPFAIRDGNLITGQQQRARAAAARLVIEALGR